MERELVAEQIDALRVEALEARRLAETLGDLQSVLDLENYAAELEAQAERLRSRKHDSAEDAPRQNRGDDRPLSISNAR